MRYGLYTPEFAPHEVAPPAKTGTAITLPNVNATGSGM
jgi:hypothetical protein